MMRIHPFLCHFLLFDSRPILEALHFLQQSNRLPDVVGIGADIWELDFGEIGVVAH